MDTSLYLIKDKPKYYRKTFTPISSKTTRPRKMIFGYEVSRTWVSNMVRSDFVYHPLGQPQAQKGVGKWSPEALACTVLMPQL